MSRVRNIQKACRMCGTPVKSNVRYCGRCAAIKKATARYDVPRRTIINLKSA